MAKKCPPGKYYCFDDKKCEKIPRGYRIGARGYLARDTKDDDNETKKNGNGNSNGNGNGGNGSGNGNGGSGGNGGGNGSGGVGESIVYETLNSKDKPFIKKLVGKLRKGSKTHAKQADDLEKAMNEDITDEALTIQDWNVDDIKFTEIETVDIIKAKPLKESMSNWREELGEDWQKVNRKDKTDGMSKAAVKAYRRENPGSKLKTAVTKDPKKLKKGSKSAKRRLSFCRRMKGMKKKLTSAKTRRDPDSRINKALRRWNC